MARDSNIKFEVCIESIASGLAAQMGGADRVELCSNLNEGGTTPSAGMIRRARAAIQLPIHCMIRPRGGDFLYTDDEFNIMMDDVEFAGKSGCNGIVIGLLTKNGQIDIGRTEKLVETARPMKVTFHRAFDLTSDPFTALDNLIALDIDYLLTSGTDSSAWNGREVLKKLVVRAGGRIEIIAGGGLTGDNVREIIDYTGVTWVHGSASQTVESGMLYRNKKVDFMAAFHPSDYIRRQTHVSNVKKIKNTISSL